MSQDKEFDEIQKAKHYNFGSIEVIRFIEEVLSTYRNPYMAFCIGNVIKYISRAMVKGTPLKDLEKCMYYLNEAINTLKKEEENNDMVEKR